MPQREAFLTPTLVFQVHGEHAVEGPGPHDRELTRLAGVKVQRQGKPRHRERQNEPNRRTSTKKQGGLLVDEHGHECQRGDAQQRDMQLEMVVEDHRSQQCHEHSAQRAAQRHGQVERGEVTRVWLEAAELAVADHASDEHHGRVRNELLGDGRAFTPEHEPHCADEGRDQRRAEPRAHVPAVVLEGYDERQ